jgi:alpha-L-fucosidase 2
MGAMVFGGVAHERIQFNESTVWSGEPRDYSHHGAYQSLGKIRELLWAGKQKEAEDLANREFMSVPLRQKAYQAFGDLELEFPELRKVRHGISARAESRHRHRERRVHACGSEVPARGIRQPSVECDCGAADAGSVQRALEECARWHDRPDVDQGCSEGRRDPIRRRHRGAARQPGVTLLLAGATNFKSYRDVSADPQTAQ